VHNVTAYGVVLNIAEDCQIGLIFAFNVNLDGRAGPSPSEYLLDMTAAKLNSHRFDVVTIDDSGRDVLPTQALDLFAGHGAWFCV
jgi:hypothetical protein